MEAKWQKVEAGWYRKDAGTGIVFEVVYDAECRLWLCRRNGEQFDAGRTLAEVKTYCVEYA